MNLLLWICVSLIAVKSGDILINFSSSSPLVFLLHTVCHKKCLFLRNINVSLIYSRDVLPSAEVLSDLYVSVRPRGQAGMSYCAEKCFFRDSDRGSGRSGLLCHSRHRMMRILRAISNGSSRLLLPLVGMEP